MTNQNDLGEEGTLSRKELHYQDALQKNAY